MTQKLSSCHECLHTTKDKNSLARAGLPTAPVCGSVRRSQTGKSADLRPATAGE